MKHPLTYAETLIDYHLCSHPKYKYTQESHMGSSIPLTQRQFLHHTVMSATGLAEPALNCVEGQGTGRAETEKKRTRLARQFSGLAYYQNLIIKVQPLGPTWWKENKENTDPCIFPSDNLYTHTHTPYTCTHILIYSHTYTLMHMHTHS